MQKQVDFGYRIPNTPEHLATASYLASELNRHGAEVQVQDADVVAFDGTVLHAKNIIGIFSPEKTDRILLFAHWDSRPFADNDPDEANHRKPVLGANDGASGVGALLEIARQLCAQIESWNRFLSGFLPVYAGVLIMGGDTSAGAAASGFFLTLLCLLAQALTAFVPPILECFLAMSMACCITEQSCLGNLCKAAGTLLQKGLSLTGKLLAALLGFQRISAAQLDRTALRTGQFLTGTIPIVGQSLSDASEAVLAGIQLLKSGLGMAAILILLAEFLPLYLGMLAHLGCIVLCGTLCSLTGNNRGQALLACFASAVRCMMACIALFFGLAVTGTALLFMLGGV